MVNHANLPNDIEDIFCVRCNKTITNVVLPKYIWFVVRHFTIRLHAHIWRQRNKNENKKNLFAQNTITFINLRTVLLPINYRYPLNNT